MLKMILYDLPRMGVVAGILIVASFGVFYFTQGDVTIEIVSPSIFPQDVSPEDGGIQVLKIVSLIPKDAIPAILEPQFLSSLAPENLMMDTEQVIGVSIDGDARAYPINILSRHEIVNDVVGGEPIAVTW